MELAMSQEKHRICTQEVNALLTFLRSFCCFHFLYFSSYYYASGTQDAAVTKSLSGWACGTWLLPFKSWLVVFSSVLTSKNKNAVRNGSNGSWEHSPFPNVAQVWIPWRRHSFNFIFQCFSPLFLFLVPPLFLRVFRHFPLHKITISSMKNSGQKKNNVGLFCHNTISYLFIYSQRT